MGQSAAQIDADRFFTRLRQVGYKSQNAVADAAGITRSSLSRYLRGEAQIPMYAVLALSKVLRCSPQWLIGEPELVPMQIREGKSAYLRQIPVSGVIPASRREASLPSQGPLDYITVPDGIIADEALEVRNGCMSPTIHEGDIVFIRRADVASPGKIYVLEVIVTGERTMKRCKVVKGRMAFVPDNPEFADAVYSVSEVRVLGEVTGWVHREK